jgi:hypothetical protein
MPCYKCKPVVGVERRVLGEGPVTSRDREREYHVQPVVVGGENPICGWWAVTSSADVTERKLIGSREGAIRLAETWETYPELIGH